MLKTRNIILTAIIACIAIIVLLGSIAHGRLDPIINSAQQYVNGITKTVSASGQLETVTCKRVVDGDTLVVSEQGKESKVRLVGVDTPESVSSDASKNCKEGKIASDYTKSLIHEGQTLYLSKDKSDTDRYGRLLRFVWMEKPSESPTQEEMQEKMLNAVLVKEGYAQAKDYAPDTTLSSFFHTLGKQAEDNNLGVSYKWKN